jgi:hypothetical protein
MEEYQERMGAFLLSYQVRGGGWISD